MTARLGATSTVREELDKALALIAVLAERIEAIEGQLAAQGDEDGPAPAPLASSWVPIKAAAALAGFSESGLRKRIDRAQLNGERRPWWHYRAGRLFVDVDRCPRRG
jgi:hypothetical protein